MLRVMWAVKGHVCFSAQSSNLPCALFLLQTHSLGMDLSKLPKIRDEDRESEFGYVHGVSGPGQSTSLYT